MVRIVSIRRLALVWTCWGLSATAVQAADAAVTFRGSLSWLNAVTVRRPASSDLNPSNTVFRVPQAEAQSELRPNLKFTAGALTLLARPRLTGQTTQVTAAGHRETEQTTTSATWREAYAQWSLSDQVIFAYGLQSYQWGAAEALSPSNRIFHETAQAKTVLYDVQGRYLARLNFSLGKSFTTVVMAELKEYEGLKDTGASPFQAGVAFQPTGLIKPEFTWNNGSDYVGVVLGGRAHDRPWVGEYFNLTLPVLDGLSFYGDTSHQRGQAAWYPVPTQQALPAAGPGAPTSQTVTTFAQSRHEERKVYTLAVTGLRYDFAGGTTLRAEYVASQASYTKEERALARAALTSQSPLQRALLPENLAKFLAPGLEVPGQRLAFASLLAPEPFNLRDLTLYARATRSMTDGSAAGYASAEYRIGDAGTLSAAAAGSRGGDGDELMGYASPVYTAAYRQDLVTRTGTLALRHKDRRCGRHT